MEVVTDLHLHSKYSRAVSPQMTLEVMSKVAKQKGIDVLATGDFTHPLWLKEMRNYLTEAEEGLFKINTGSRIKSGMTEGENEKTRFLLSVEISCIYSQGGKGRRIHNLVFAPSFAVVEKINNALLYRGCNLSSDGRPIIGMSSRDLLAMILEIDDRCLLIPAHAWTPWFGVYGMKSGFDSLEECFGDMSQYLYGIETGLSSDPEMNWQMKELDTRSILSFSDAHSPAKMGRELTIFELEHLSYETIREAIMRPSLKRHPREGEDLDSRLRGNDKVLYTIEFYPEEGKYHYSGHRNCKVTMTPEEQKESNGICPVCGRHVTDGVMRRVQELATQDAGVQSQQNTRGSTWYTDARKIHPPFVKIVPLNEIIAEAIGSPVASTKVKVIFDELCAKLDSELYVLLKAPREEIEHVAGSKIAEGVQKVRTGSIVISPGYDGVYGKVNIWHEARKKSPKKVQLGLEF